MRRKVTPEREAHLERRKERGFRPRCTRRRTLSAGMCPTETRGWVENCKATRVGITQSRHMLDARNDSARHPTVREYGCTRRGKSWSLRIGPFLSAKSKESTRQDTGGSVGHASPRARLKITSSTRQEPPGNHGSGVKDTAVGSIPFMSA